MSDFYTIPVTLADGTTTTMNNWAGHVLLIATPASTSAHADILAELFTDYAPRGFFVLGTPPDTTDTTGDTTAETPFPYLTHADTLFEYLGDGDTFIIDPDGNLIGRFDATTEPDDLTVTDLIETNLPI